MAFKNFDDIFDHIGGFGPYQWILFALVCYYNCILVFNYFGQIFMVLTPPHWCSPSPNFANEVWNKFGVNLTAEEIVNLTIPPNEFNTKGFEKCKRYDFNITQMNSYNEITQLNTSWPTTECTYGWDYNFTFYYPTITSQLNWVCADDWKPPLAQAGFFVGSMIGGPLFGGLADYFGRVRIVVVSNLIGLIFGVATSFSTSFITFCCLRFIVGLIHDSDFMILYILALEYVSPPYRTFISNVPIMVFLTASMCALPWIAYGLSDWTLFGIAISLPSIISLGIPWVAPESARWLISNGKTEKAISILKKAAKINGKHLSEDVMVDFRVFVMDHSEKDASKDVAWYEFLKRPILRRRFLALVAMWIAIFLSYDGFVRLSENVDFDFFIIFSIMGLVEFPADLLTIFAMEWLGRKHTTVWTLVTAGLIAMSTVFIPQGEATVYLFIVVTARFFITMSINVGQQYIVEILPTAGRAQGSGAIHTFGTGVGFLSPYIVYLSKLGCWIPYFTFGLISVVGGVMSIMLPETLGEQMPDSLEDGEKAFTNQPLFYNPCHKKLPESDTKEDEQELQENLLATE